MSKDKHTTFMRSIELPRSGSVQLDAHEKAKFLGVWEKDWNGKTTKPHLVLEDCPTKKQITYRFLVLEGEATIPVNERWIAMGFVWRTSKNTFATLHMSGDPAKEEEKIPAKKTNTPIPDEEVGQHVEAYAP